jgi:integrase
MAKRVKLDPKLEAWIGARRRHRLSHAHVQMARELGMNPTRLGAIDDHRQEPWNLPRSEFIEHLYEKRVGKTRFCSHLAMRGAPAKAIQELAGHADLTTTMRYMHLSPAARQDAIGLLNGRESGRIFGEIVETRIAVSASERNS